MTLGVAFVNFHSEGLIVPRVAALREAGIEVLVADNSGTYPDTPERVQPARNLGFGGGCNVVTRAFPPPVRTVCFHNPDVTLPVDDLLRLERTLRQQARPGALAPAELDGDVLRTRGYRYPSLAREAALAMTAKRRRSQAPSRNGLGRRASTGGRRFGGGGLLVVDRRAHEAIGGFDERYFLYVEDLDYWDRMDGSGRDVGFDEHVVARHLSGSGSPVGWVTRELLRWLGVELFVELRRLRWRPYRAAHRLALRRLPPSSLSGVVLAAWARGDRPAAALDAVRARLSAGELLDIAEPS